MQKEVFTIGDYEIDRSDLEDWGMEYLRGTDDEIFNMSDLDWLEKDREPKAILYCAFFGSDYFPYGDDGRFNPNREYFTYDGYGNYMSIDSNYLAERIELCLDSNDFIDWCIRQGYIEEEEEEEEEEELNEFEDIEDILNRTKEEA